MKNMKKLLALALVIISVLSISIPALAVTGLQIGQTGTVSVNSAGLKIRNSPSTSSSTYWLVGDGTEVRITSVPNSTWYGVEVTKYVKGSNGTGYVGLKGYAMASFISGTPITPTNPTTPPSGGTPSGTPFTAVIGGTEVNVRQNSPTGNSLGTVNESDGVFTCYRPATPVQSGGHFWVQIKDNANNKFAGDYGWIAATYVMSGSSMANARTSCSVCGNGVTQISRVRSFYKNTGNGYHNCDGGSLLICSINMGKEVRTYQCNNNSSHPNAKTVIFTDGIRGCQLENWKNFR